MADNNDPLMHAAYEDLAQFAGTPVVILVMDDAEALVFARDLAGILKGSGWQPETRTARAFDGVSVYSGYLSAPLTADPIAIERDISWVGNWRAGDAVANLININFEMFETGLSGLGGGTARTVPRTLYVARDGDAAIPDGAVVVEIGLRPVMSQLMLLKYGMAHTLLKEHQTGTNTKPEK